MKKLKLVIVASVLFALCLAIAGCGNGTPVVKDPTAYVETITLKYNGELLQDTLLTLEKSSSDHTLEAVVTGKGDGIDKVKFTSSNTAVATVSDDGTLALTGVGETIVTVVSVADESKKAYVVVKVTDDTVSEKYKVTVVGGTANVSAAAEGTIVTIAADKLEGRTFVGWDFDNDDLWVNGNIFRMPAADVTVTANHETLSYKLSVEGAVAKVDGEPAGDTVLYGKEVVLEPEQIPTGKKFAEWVHNGTFEITENIFTMPASDVTVSASYDFIDYNISVNGGNYSGTPHYGENITLELSEDVVIPDGQMHIGWKGTDGDVGVNYGSNSFVMPASDVTVEPVFARGKVVSLSKTVDTGAGTTQTTSGKDVIINGLPGTSYPLPATTTSGYVFRIRGGGILCDRDKVAQVTLTNDSDYEIEAEYLLEFLGDTSRTTGKLTIPAHGQVTGLINIKSIPKDTEPYGETPYAQVILHKNIGGGYGETVNIGIQVNEANAEEFSGLPHNVTVEGGSYTVSGGYITDAAYEGDSIILVPEDKADSRFVGWTSDDVTVENNAFVMPGKDVTVKAVYEQIVYYTITVNGGSASAERAEAGTTVTLYPEIPEGQKLVRWDVTEGDVTIENNSFVMPHSNVAVTAVFEDLDSGEYSITVTDGSYEGTPSEGEIITLSVNEDAIPDGQMLVGWTGIAENGVSYGIMSFEMPARNLTIVPVFAAARSVTLTGSTDGGSYSIPGPAGTATEINGIAGYSYAIDAAKTNGYMFRIRTGDISLNTHTVAEVVLKNEGDYDITLEYFLEFLGEKKGTTGAVTVRSGETLVCYMEVMNESLDEKPYPAVVLHSDIGGQTGESVPLAIAVRAAEITE